MDQFFRSVASVFTCNIRNIYISSRFYLHETYAVAFLGYDVYFPVLSLVIPADYGEPLTFEEFGRNSLSDLPNPSVFLLFGHKVSRESYHGEGVQSEVRALFLDSLQSTYSMQGVINTTPRKSNTAKWQDLSHRM